MPHFDYRFVSSSDLALNDKSVALSDSFGPDMVFIHIQASGVISEDTVKHLKVNGAWVCNWTGDIRVPTPKWYYDIGKHIDLTLFTNEEDAVILRDLGVPAGFMQIGIDPDIYTPEGPVRKVCDIAFMANNYNGDFPLSDYRRDTADLLRKRYRGRFGLFGSGWSKLSNGNLYSSQTDEAAVYRGSKMAINISHFDSERYSSDRIFRILGSGTLCLCKEFPGWYRDFKDQVNIVMWRDHDHLISLIEYYSKNEKDRSRIAHNGYRLAHDKYLFAHTVEHMLKYYHASLNLPKLIVDESI